MKLYITLLFQPPKKPLTFHERLDSAFTLIELSIVLVVIGLIVGGVLVGRDLVGSSQLRAEVTQFEQYNSAVNTFKNKFDCIPGDCVNATNFFPTLPGVDGAMNGDGNGMLSDANNNGVNTTGFPLTVEPEPTLFWVHLWSAGLTKCCNPATIGNYLSGWVIGIAFPADMINGNGIATGNLGGRNGYFWGINHSCPYVNGGQCTCGNGNSLCGLVQSNSTGVITPSQGKAFDTKIDDGLPTTGNIYTTGIGGDNALHPRSNPNCVASTTPATYNTSYTLPACNLWINMQ